VQVATGDGLLEIVLSRLEDWHEIHVENRVPGEIAGAVTIEDVVQCTSVELEDMLAWLRAGCQYLTEGDWNTAAGFVLRYS
jgi:hypothetical protein